MKVGRAVLGEYNRWEKDITISFCNYITPKKLFIVGMNVLIVNKVDGDIVIGDHISEHLYAQLEEEKHGRR